MPDMRIKDLPPETLARDTDLLPVDDNVLGTRAVTVATFKKAADLRGFVVTATVATITVTAGTRWLKSGAAINFGGGTIASPPAAGTNWLVVTAAGALALRTVFPPGTNDDLVIATIIATGSPVTAVTASRPDFRHGDMLNGNNLAGLTDVIASRQNLGVGFQYLAQSPITGAGDTPLPVPDGVSNGTFRYSVTAGPAPYTRTISVSSNNGAGGTKCTILLDMPAEAINSPAIEIRSFAANGTLLATVLGGPYARTVRVQLVYNPTTWVLESVGPEPHAGLQQLNEVSANRTPTGGIKFDGVQNRFAEGVIKGISLGSGDYSVAIIFRPFTNPDPTNSMGLFSVGGVVGGFGATGEVGVYSPSSGNSHFLYVRDTATTAVVAAVDFRPWYGRTIQLGVVRRLGVMSLFIDGEPFQGFTPPSNQSLPMSGADTIFRLGAVGNGWTGYQERIEAFQIYNRALTAAELRMLSVRGVAGADRAALGTMVSGATLNGNLETWTADGVYGVSNGAAPGWNFFGFSNGGSVTKNTISPIGGSYDLMFHQANVAEGGVAPPGAFITGSSYRLRFAAFRKTGLASLSMINGQINTPIALWGLTTGAAVNINYEFVNYGTLPYFTLSAANSDVQLDNFIIESIGCLVDVDLGVGVGYSLPDVQGRFPAVVNPAGYAGLQHIRPTRRGQFVTYITSVGANQNIQIPGLPLNARISSIIADAMGGTPNITVGTASGLSGIVASAGLALGKQDLTLVTRYTSTGNLWVNISTTATLQLTVNFELVS